MYQNYLKFLLISIIFNFSQAQKNLFIQKRKEFSLLRDLTCAVAADEFAKHPEMWSIVLVELKNDFSKTFSAEILKCLPKDVIKKILDPRKFKVKLILSILFDGFLMKIPKESLVILVLDEVKKVRK